ncbi:Uncharacterised protein [Mycolicibacterium vanbaalenii]|uniref:Uncharacterized protein n=1 Tax=Mycolicibacterium vanbaalenii TaxID=110539 RepID=A0A5S9R0V8_MYCVN|nr:hypothetical protein [Mycolicibacterium vanbaalenii]CAA0126685.1 Uncharacterised protein [Mycolicibacterium vanbaalenii]
MLSHSSGIAEPPLLDATISDNLARTAERFEDREALIGCATGRRWTYAEPHEAGGAG